MNADRVWFALVQTRPEGATAAARAQRLDTGEHIGWLAAWARPSKPVRHALRASPAAFDPDGPPMLASYVLVGSGRSVIFDDPAVQRARQLVLAAARPWTAVTTLVSDDVHFRGSLLAAPDLSTFDDPFATIAPRQLLTVESGLLSAGPLVLPSPVVERYAGKPWPQSGF